MKLTHDSLNVWKQSRKTVNNNFNWLKLPRGTVFKGREKIPIYWLSLVKVLTTNVELWLTIKLQFFSIAFTQLVTFYVLR